MAFDYDNYMPPEIKNDSFYSILIDIARRFPLRTILEIGASSGEGSTEALVHGLAENPGKPTLFCIEVSRARYERLAQRYAGNPQVKPYNASSVNLKDFPSEAQVIEFYQMQPYNLNMGETNIGNWPLELVLTWLRNDIKYLTEHNIQQDGISLIKRKHSISQFDMVLIDGSEFTGSAELLQVYGAPIIAMDDINTCKNGQTPSGLLR